MASSSARGSANAAKNPASGSFGQVREGSRKSADVPLHLARTSGPIDRETIHGPGNRQQGQNSEDRKALHAIADRISLPSSVNQGSSTEDREALHALADQLSLPISTDRGATHSRGSSEKIRKKQDASDKHNRQLRQNTRDNPVASPVRLNVPEQNNRKSGEDNLILRRLRQAYGYNISDVEIRHICKMDAKNGDMKVEPASLSATWTPEAKGITKTTIVGRDVMAISGQVVRHVGRGKRSEGAFDGDYLSGGETGKITDVCGDYAQVRWNNGNVRFYFVGGTPWRKDSNGNNTDNPRAVRCLALASS